MPKIQISILLLVLDVQDIKMFCRKSKFLSCSLNIIGDELMKNEQQTEEQFIIKEGDIHIALLIIHI